MTDDLGTRKAGRRRRTTRRLTRRPIRVPGDDVPRQSKADGDEDSDVDSDVDTEAQDLETSQDRPSADLLDVDLDAESESVLDGPTSGVVPAPPRPSAISPLSVNIAKSVVMPGNIAMHAPAPATSASIPPPAPASESVPPPEPATVPPRAARPPGPATVPPTAARDSGPPEEKTNPQIRLAEIGELRDSTLPPPKAASTDHEEPTRPRIELSDMVMSAVRSSSSSQPAGDETDVDTNPRIPIAVEDDFSPVIVTRSRFISDRPRSEYEDTPRPSARPISSLDVDELEPLELDDESSPRLDLPPSVVEAVAASVGPRPVSDPARVSKAPPPPPPTEIAIKPSGRKSTVGSSVPMPPPAAMQPGVQSPQPPAAALKAPPPPPPGAPKKGASVAAAPPKGPKRRSWWEDFFSDDYLHSVIRPTAAQISRQVDFIEGSAGLSPGQTVLDVGCGLGLHALELARRGYLVVGLDLSLPMITRAAEAAQQEGLRINFLHSDLREIAFQSMFDVIVCFGTTFGFFDEDTNRDVLARLYTSLKPGGRLLLDVVNRDHVIPSQPNLVWFEGDGCVVMEESDFNYYSSRLVVKRTMMRDDGRQSEAEYSLRLYSLHELGQMMQQVGFRVNEVSGQEATRGVYFGSSSPRILLLAERRAKAQNPSVVVAPPESDDGNIRPV